MFLSEIRELIQTDTVRETNGERYYPILERENEVHLTSTPNFDRKNWNFEKSFHGDSLIELF